MSSRALILDSIRRSLGRAAGSPPKSPPPLPRINVPDVPLDLRVSMFTAAIEKLAGKTFVAASESEVRDYVVALLEGRTAIASNAPILNHCGVTSLTGVRSNVHDKAELRNLCALSDVGITGADFALADTGSLVMISSPQEARMVSLLPPVHIAVVDRSRILTGLDELFTLVPKPADVSSSMVLITGPSRTADIEQILVRGVHGPGEIHVIVI